MVRDSAHTAAAVREGLPRHQTGRRAAWRRWSAELPRRLFARIDIGPLVYFRMLFGAVLAFQIYKFFAEDWIHAFYLGPRYHFKFFGFEWVKAWPGDGLRYHFIALGFLSACITLGFLYRAAAFLFALGFAYVLLLEQSMYQNHFYLMFLTSLLLAVVPANRALSLDALIWPRIRSTSAPAWTLWLLRFQLGIPYFYGGLAKINRDWLRCEPMRMWLFRQRDFPVIGGFFDDEWMIHLFSYGALFFDLLIVPLLLCRRTRLIAIVPAVLFHLLNSRLFNIGVFPWLMIGATAVLFFSDRLPLVPRRRPGPKENAQPAGRSAGLSWRQKLMLTALTAYVCVQLVVPFRHFLYPGYVNWTEEGHYFSWHMLLRDKQVKPPRLFIYSRKDGVQSARVVQVGPMIPGMVPSHSDVLLLPAFQYQDVLYHPDMLLQLCHFLADDLRRQGHEDVDIRVELYVSLNGRQPQIMFDRNYNLAAQPRTLAPAPWILPLVER